MADLGDIGVVAQTQTEDSMNVISKTWPNVGIAVPKIGTPSTSPPVLLVHSGE